MFDCGKRLYNTEAPWPSEQNTFCVIQIDVQSTKCFIDGSYGGFLMHNRDSLCLCIKQRSHHRPESRGILICSCMVDCISAVQLNNNHVVIVCINSSNVWAILSDWVWEMCLQKQTIPLPQHTGKFFDLQVSFRILRSRQRFLQINAIAFPSVIVKQPFAHLPIKPIKTRSPVLSLQSGAHFYEYKHAACLSFLTPCHQWDRGGGH